MNFLAITVFLPLQRKNVARLDKLSEWSDDKIGGFEKRMFVETRNSVSLPYYKSKSFLMSVIRAHHANNIEIMLSRDVPCTEPRGTMRS
jgi:hypothetical protein